MNSLRMEIAVIGVTGWLTTTACHAVTDNVAEGMVMKALSGAIDMVTGVIEFPVQTYKGYKNGFEPIESKGTSKVVGTVLGIIRGISHAAGRMGWGAMELIGFWTANASDNKGVGEPFDAKYAWQWGKQYSYFDPSLIEGVKPIGRKLVRGLTDNFLGILELPGQTIQGSNQGDTGKGLCRGIWFWLSRQVYGFGGILTCLVPNPRDNPGYAFDGRWPWSALFRSAPEVDG